MSDHYPPQAVQLLIEALEQNRLPFVHVRSDSMAPLLRQGDQIQLGPVGPDGPAVGDIIVTGVAEDLLAHRFWGIKLLEGRPCLLTRGDRLAYYDPYTPEAHLRAIVVARRRTGRLLPLRLGPGARLNRALTLLAGYEARLMRLPLPLSSIEPDQTIGYGFTRRLARRGLRTLAALMCLLAGLSAE